MDERQQKELFEFEKPKRSFPRLANILPKPDFEGKVSITFGLERLVFISIGIIMLMVIVYALGIEKGKSIISIPQAVQHAAPVLQKQAENIVAPAAQDTGKPYTIVAVTFRGKDTAMQELNKLKKEGFDTSLIQSDAYFQVRIGTYPDKDSAQSKKALARVRTLYKDAYFKLR